MSEEAAAPVVAESESPAESKRTKGTKTTMQMLKNGMADFKLFTKDLTGMIEVSEVDPVMKDALQRLDAVHQQLYDLLGVIDGWATSQEATALAQAKVVVHLQQIANVSRGTSQAAPVPASEEPPPGDASVDGAVASSAPSSMETVEAAPQEGASTRGVETFAAVCGDLHQLLSVDHDRYKERQVFTRTLAVDPVRNILRHEILHAIEMRKRYAKAKRGYDDIETQRRKLEAQLEGAADKQQAPTMESTNAFKTGFAKLFKRDDTAEVEKKLAVCRQQSEQLRARFEMGQRQFLEAMNIVEQKLNIEVVHYLKQFRECCSTWNASSLQSKAALPELPPADDEVELSVSESRPVDDMAEPR